MANNKKKRDIAEQLVELARKPGVIVTVLAARMIATKALMGIV